MLQVLRHLRMFFQGISIKFETRNLSENYFNYSFSVFSLYINLQVSTGWISQNLLCMECRVDGLDPPPHHIAISQYFKMPLKCHRLPVLGTRNGSLTFPPHLSEPHSQTEKEAPNVGGSSSKRLALLWPCTSIYLKLITNSGIGIASI